MGFDTPNGSDFKIPVSDTQAYRQFGNAVVVPVVQDIAREMKNHILYSMEHKTQTRSQKRDVRISIEDSHSLDNEHDERVRNECAQSPILSHHRSSMRTS